MTSTKDNTQYIAFDLDGTVTDPMIGITKSVQYALDKFDIKVDDLHSLCKFIGPPLKESFMEFYQFSKTQAEQAIVYFREYFSTYGIFENEVYDGMRELLAELNEQGYHIVLATSKPELFAKRILHHFELEQYFEYVFGSNMDETRTKKCEVIAYCLETIQLEDTSRIIMVGDRKHDVIGAAEHGISSIGVLYGYGDYEELSENKATYIVKDIKELREVLLQR